MKNALLLLVRGYFMIGSIFALIMWATYMWSIGWGAPSGSGFLDGVFANLSMQPVIIFAAFVRLVLWLPSLIYWLINPGSTSFGMWLAPGMYAELIPAG